MDINKKVSFDIIKNTWEDLFNDIRNNKISDSITLQFHIPFCPQNCTFCNCSLIDIDNDSINKYMTLFEKQVFLYKDIFKWQKINHIFISGGSPSFIGLDNISKIFRLLNSNFFIDNSTLIWYEIDPIFTNEDILKEISNYPWKIVCEIWIQTINDKVLEKINRYQSNDRIKELTSLVKKYNFWLCTDIILWLPWEDLNSFKKTVDFVIELWSDMINAFELELFWNEIGKKYNYKFDNKDLLNIDLMNNYLNNHFEDRWWLKSEVIVWYWWDNYKHKAFFPNKNFYTDNLWREKWSVLSLWYWDESFILGKLIYKLNNNFLEKEEVNDYLAYYIDLKYSIKKYFLINFAWSINKNTFYQIFKRDIMVELKRELDILVKYNKVIIIADEIQFNFASIKEIDLFQQLLFKLKDKNE